MTEILRHSLGMFISQHPDVHTSHWCRPGIWVSTSRAGSDSHGRESPGCDSDSKTCVTQVCLICCISALMYPHSRVISLCLISTDDAMTGLIQDAPGSPRWHCNWQVVKRGLWFAPSLPRPLPACRTLGNKSPLGLSFSLWKTGKWTHLSPKSRDITLPIRSIWSIPVVVYRCESWIIKKAESWRIDAFELWCWRRLRTLGAGSLESCLDRKEIKTKSVLKEINPEYSLKALMLKLKLLYFSHPIRRANPLEKILMLGKIEGRRRGQPRMSWLDGTDSMNKSLSKLQEMVKDREDRRATVHGVARSWAWLSNWTATTPKLTVGDERLMRHARVYTGRHWSVSGSAVITDTILQVSNRELNTRDWFLQVIENEKPNTYYKATNR